jgi:hypothetical protein
MALEDFKELVRPVRNWFSHVSRFGVTEADRGNGSVS